MNTFAGLSASYTASDRAVYGTAYIHDGAEDETIKGNTSDLRPYRALGKK